MVSKDRIIDDEKKEVDDLHPISGANMNQNLTFTKSQNCEYLSLVKMSTTDSKAGCMTLSTM